MVIIENKKLSPFTKKKNVAVAAAMCIQSNSFIKYDDWLVLAECIFFKKGRWWGREDLLQFLLYNNWSIID